MGVLKMLAHSKLSFSKIMARERGRQSLLKLMLQDVREREVQDMYVYDFMRKSNHLNALAANSKSMSPLLYKVPDVTYILC